MTGDLSVKLGNGKKLEAAASNEVVESIGVTVAKVNEKFEIEEVRKTKGGREGEKKKNVLLHLRSSEEAGPCAWRCCFVPGSSFRAQKRHFPFLLSVDQLLPPLR